MMRRVVSGLLVLLVLLAALWGALALLAQRASAKLEAEYPPQGEIIEVEGAPMHIVVRGPEAGDAPDLVLIHGSNGSTRDMTEALARDLAGEFRVYVVDRPGLGYSAARNPKGDSITQQARLIAAAAEAMGADRPIVLGQSYGGAVALAWAVHMPERLSALVLLASPSHPWDTPLDPLYRAGAHPVAGRLLLPLLPAVVTDARMKATLKEVFAPDSVPQGYFEETAPRLSLRYSSMRATALQRRNLLGEIEALAPQYGALTLPIELLHGRQDTIVGLPIHSEPLACAVPSARLTRLEGHGHMIHYSAKADVYEAVRRAATRRRD